MYKEYEIKLIFMWEEIHFNFYSCTEHVLKCFCFFNVLLCVCEKCCMPDNMPLHQMKIILDYCLSKLLWQQDPKITAKLKRNSNNKIAKQYLSNFMQSVYRF
jgi:hypothetical protein